MIALLCLFEVVILTILLMIVPDEWQVAIGTNAKKILGNKSKQTNFTDFRMDPTLSLSLE